MMHSRNKRQTKTATENGGLAFELQHADPTVVATTDLTSVFGRLFLAVCQPSGMIGAGLKSLDHSTPTYYPLVDCHVQLFHNVF